MGYNQMGHLVKLIENMTCLVKLTNDFLIKLNVLCYFLINKPK